MKISRQVAFRIALVVVFITTYLFAPGFSPGGIFEAKQAGVRTKAEQARTVPVSNKMIRAKITIDDHDDSAVISQLEGGLIRIERPGGAIYGFSPFVSDPANETFTIKVYRINQVVDAEGMTNEGLSEVDALIANKAGKFFTTYADAEGRFKIEVLDVQTISYAIDAQGQSNSDDVLTACCVRCRGETVCGCGVSTVCIDCCGKACCRSTK